MLKDWKVVKECTGLQFIDKDCNFIDMLTIFSRQARFVEDITVDFFCVKIFLLSTSRQQQQQQQMRIL